MLSEVITSQVFEPDLFVEAPEQYFIEWSNYPIRNAKFKNELDEKSTRFKENYNLIVFPPEDENNLFDFIHPYDDEENTFVNEFKIIPPYDLKIIESNNIDFSKP